MLQNAYLFAKIGADTAENERNFAEFCQKLATTLRALRLSAALLADQPALIRHPEPAAAGSPTVLKGGGSFLQRAKGLQAVE